MHRLIALVFLAGCVTVKKGPWDPAPRFAAPPAPITVNPMSPERVLDDEKVLAEGNTALHIKVTPPPKHYLAGPMRFRVSEMAGTVTFKPGERKFSLAKPSKSFYVPFNVKEGRAEVRLVLEYYHCRRINAACFKEESYYRVTMDAAKGRGLTYVPVVVKP